MSNRIVIGACLAGLLGFSGVVAAEDKQPAPTAIPKCRALDMVDATKIIAEAEDKLSMKCTRLLNEKVKAAVCADPANKGKKVEYNQDFDHMVGTGKFAKKVASKKASLTCPKK